MSHKKKLPSWLIVLLALLLAGLLAVMVLNTVKDMHEPVEQVTTPVLKVPAAKESGQVIVKAEKPVVPQVDQLRAESGITLILDDVGYDIPALRRILNLSVPVAIAVIPDAPYAAESAELAHQAGQVVMLHLPMEPSTEKYRKSMSAAFLHEKMSMAQLRATFHSNLDKVPYVEGVNNHMGSYLTELEEPMRGVMQLCYEQGLFFVDSKTSAKSVAADAAQTAGIAWASRQIFLDHDIDEAAMLKAWQRARRCVDKGQRCVVIAHPHRETLMFLEKYLSRQDASSMVSVKRLLTPAVSRQVKQHRADVEPVL